jgi:calcineurin-like phosphoesterase family protein
MSTVRFIGCLHLGHDKLAQWRGFVDANQQDEYLIRQWNKVVTKKDLTYILGDVTMESNKDYYKLGKLNGRKIVVLGNHDKAKHVKDLLEYVESVAGVIGYKGCMLTHVPVHPMETGRFRANIHAHIHHNNKLVEVECPNFYQDTDSIITNTLHKYYCVDAKLLDFTPVSLVDLGITK